MFLHPVVPTPLPFLRELAILNTAVLIMLLVIIETTPRAKRAYTIYPVAVVFMILLIYTAVSQFSPGTL